MALFEAQILLACTAEEAFDFLIQTANIELLSDPRLDMEIIAAPDTLEMGSRIEFTVNGFGIPQNVIHRISSVDRPNQFIEEQETGPLQLWRHEHLFSANESGQVTVIDRIEFEPPGGVAGFLINEERIRASLDGGFQHRHEHLASHFGRGTD